MASASQASVRSRDAVAEIGRIGIVAIMRHTDARLAVATAAALEQGGIGVIEVTMNTAGALAMIEDLSRALGGRLLLGAGTVLSPTAAARAIDAGARFIVAPNTDLQVISYCRQRDVPVIPGALTPTEVLGAWEAGAEVVKVFPVGSLGPRYIRDLRGPLPDIPLLPTGGVTLENAAEFIRAGAFALGVGSELVARDLVAQRDFDALADRARAFVRAVAEGRS